ncbi:4-alpha-glucanotransferase [Cyanobium sp. ATX-6F1]|uniref:4-alpha-glucanotransferase n=1 Tax=Cyanobium sp. ATX-6F1 TaxID=3137388 RepID=UPI0039BEAE03
MSSATQPSGGRRCGVLLHPTALPHTPGCGTLGAQAHRWVELLAAHRVAVWQLLPLAPTDGTGSPYSSPSGFALNPWLLDGELLASEGFIAADGPTRLPAAETERLDLEGAPAGRKPWRSSSWSTGPPRQPSARRSSSTGGARRPTG